MSAAQPPILVVDLETTSANRLNAGIVEIGAIWLHPAYGARHGLWFEMKCRPRDGVQIDAEALAVNGCDWLNDPTVASEREALERFNDWIASSLHSAHGEIAKDSVIMAGQNVGQFDWMILQLACAAAGELFAFPFRVMDLHSIAFYDALRNGIDDLAPRGMTSGEIMEFCGLPREPKPHRALCGALLEHRALWELLAADPPPGDLGALEARFFPSGLVDDRVIEAPDEPPCTA